MARSSGSRSPRKRPRSGRPSVAAAPPASRAPSLDTLQVVEDTLRSVLGAPLPAETPSARGRPPLLPAMALWAGLLVCVARGLRHQADIWRLLTQHGLWDLPRYAVTDMAVYKRLEATPPTVLARFFSQITALLRAQFPAASATHLAPFAPEIYALDRTVLDKVTRKAQFLRGCASKDPRLLPGALACLFDVRRQLWVRLRYVERPEHDPREDFAPFLQHVVPSSLLLFDLGYFGYWIFDRLTELGYHWISRVRSQVSFTPIHVLYAGSGSGLALRDELVYLGQYRADRGAQPVRLLTLTRAGQTRQYLTSVLDPHRLPAWQVVALYQRRWDIEQAFNLVKTHLGLYLLWSSHRNVLLHQIFATFIIAQIVLSLRAEVARQARVDLEEVSLPLLLRWLPWLAHDGHDALAEFVRRGREAGYLRPTRRGRWEVLRPEAADYQLPPEPPPSRTPRYGNRDQLRRATAGPEAPPKSLVLDTTADDDSF